jgi:DNA invertase Pin-like site-specific DNA recombinase
MRTVSCPCVRVWCGWPDRLARSTRHLLNILYTLGERGVGFKSLADSWADTTTPHGRLLVTMLAGIAEFEQELIRARTGDGRTRAKARGVLFWQAAGAFRPSAPRSYPRARQPPLNNPTINKSESRRHRLSYIPRMDNTFARKTG